MTDAAKSDLLWNQYCDTQFVKHVAKVSSQQLWI